jgi:hypothetical protein
VGEVDARPFKHRAFFQNFRQTPTTSCSLPLILAETGLAISRLKRRANLALKIE